MIASLKISEPLKGANPTAALTIPKPISEVPIMADSQPSCALPPFPSCPGVQFRVVPGFFGYAIGDDGSIWSRRIGGRTAGTVSRKWKRLRQQRDKDGYYIVALYRLDGTVRVFRISHLVLTAFVGPCPPGMEACHDDGNNADNRLGNLRWDTHGNNIRDKKRHGTEVQGERHYHARLTSNAVSEIRLDYARGVMAKTLAAQHGVKTGTIYDIVYRRSWKHLD